MNWGKILNKLIFVFFILNIILGFFNFSKNIKAYIMTSNSQKDIIHMLSTKNITVEANIPRIAMPKPSVWIMPENITLSEKEALVQSILGKENVTISNIENKRHYTKDSKRLVFDYNTMTYTDTEAAIKFENINEKKAKKEADLFLKKLRLGNNFKRAKVNCEKEGNIFCFTYYETINSLPVFNSRVKVIVSDRGIIYAQFNKVKITKAEATRKYIYPADKVLFGIEDYLGTSEPIVIRGITLGYGLSDDQSVDIFEDEAVPTYKIDILNKDEPLYINAYTNNLQ